MVKDSEIVTKKFLAKELLSFHEDIRAEMKEQKIEIIREVHIMMYETMQSGMENMKVYYEEQSNRHREALLQGFKDEMRVYKDEMKIFVEQLNNHDHRITALEVSRL